MMKVIRVLTVLLLSGVMAAANADPEGEARYRQGVMKSVGGHMTAISMIMRQGIHTDALKFHADALAALAKQSKHIYPEGSNVSRSEALPAIWNSQRRSKRLHSGSSMHLRHLRRLLAQGTNVPWARRFVASVDPAKGAMMISGLRAS